MKFHLNLSVDDRVLKGELQLPENMKGIVIFSHGSGSSRLSPRNTFVANVLNDHRIGTLLFDLLTEEEDALYENRFNISLLTKRLVGATHFFQQQYPELKLPFGYFGASTGAASALMAAAELPSAIRAVVSRGGRPDLAMEKLPSVLAPTLLIVGALDQDVLQLNRNAYDQLKCVKRLEIVPDATHLFEEPGTLEEVARLAATWFDTYLTKKKNPI